jgi:AbrB family looped-hinge helix DNA binding protein
MAKTESELVQLRGRAQITLPAFVRRRLALDVGDILDVSIRDGEIVLRPKKLVDHAQAWFWSRRWQVGESQADEDLATGKVHRFDDADSAVAFLKSRAQTPPEESGD